MTSHDYSARELEQLRGVYDEQGETALEIEELRALRFAGMLPSATPHKPEPEPEPERMDNRLRPEVRKNVLDTLTRLNNTGTPPTLTRIAQELHLTKATIQYHVNQLAKDGLIRKDNTSGHWLPAGAATGVSTKRELILEHCRRRISRGEPVSSPETAQALGLNAKTCSNIIGRLRTQGLLPEAKPGRKPKPGSKPDPKAKEQKEEHMEPTPQATGAATTAAAPVQATGEPDLRTAIADSLTHIYEAVSALQRLAFQANDKVVYGFASKLINGELMDIKANYSRKTEK